MAGECVNDEYNMFVSEEKEERRRRIRGTCIRGLIRFDLLSETHSRSCC